MTAKNNWLNSATQFEFPIPLQNCKLWWGHPIACPIYCRENEDFILIDRYSCIMFPDNVYFWKHVYCTYVQYITRFTIPWILNYLVHGRIPVLSFIIPEWIYRPVKFSRSKSLFLAQICRFHKHNRNNITQLSLKNQIWMPAILKTVTTS